MSQTPNIIFIMPDQLRADFLSCYGAPFIDTPHIDSLARDGVRYENAYSAHPLCVPARVALLTGMDAMRNGVLDNGQFLRPDYARCGIRTWPEILQEQGYYTAAIGKMHFYPWDLRLGFQYRVIAEDKRWIHIRDDYYHFLHAHGHRKYHGEEYPHYHDHKGAVVSLLPWELSVDHFVGQEACRFIREYGTEGPFAMMIGFPGPHCPYNPAPEFLERFDPDDMPDAIPEVAGMVPGIRRSNVEGNRLPWNGVDYAEFTTAQKKRVRAHYAALVAQIDHEIGQLLEALQETGLRENTVIIFASDHGDYLGDHGMVGKGHFFESSIHVPLLVHLPWAAGMTTRPELVTLSDVTGTMLGLASCEIPAYMDARHLPGLGDLPAVPRERIFGALAGGWMMANGQWRLSKYGTGEATLFNLAEDPGEQNNLVEAPGYRDVYRRLDAELTQAVMNSLNGAHFERRVYTQGLSQEPTFGREGWQRSYPRSIQESEKRR